jgi:glycosyltransferase involved in cell wall biosynthesis
MISDASFEGAAARVVARLVDRTDVLYGHFLYPSGRAVARLGRKYDLPVFVAHGDGVLNEMYIDHVAQDFSNVTGAIAVSSPNRRFCLDVLHLSPDKVGLFPNGVDLANFRPRDKAEMRRRLGFPSESRLAAFVGHFNPGKGPDRVLRAVKRINGLQLLLIGSGPMKLADSRIAFLGEVEHHLLPEYLSAADVFVLPTLQEGCCNSLLEAMASGLPVVSSIGEFNDDILNDGVSIRVDPLDIEAISRAINTVLGDESLRRRMSENCIRDAQKFSVDNRARAMLEWMESLVGRPGTRKRVGAERV